MSVDEGRRLLLHDAARTAFGADAALVLMEMLPPTGWGDVATRQQLEAVEDRFDLRLEALESRLTAAFKRGQRRTMQWMVTTMVAMTGAFAALTRLG